RIGKAANIEIPVGSESQAAGVIQSAASAGNEDVEECPCRPVVAQHAGGGAAAHVEVAIRAKFQAAGSTQTTAASRYEGTEERPGGQIVAQDFVGAKAADQQVRTGTRDSEAGEHCHDQRCEKHVAFHELLLSRSISVAPHGSRFACSLVAVAGR